MSNIKELLRQQAETVLEGDPIRVSTIEEAETVAQEIYQWHGEHCMYRAVEGQIELMLLQTETTNFFKDWQAMPIEEEVCTTCSECPHEGQDSPICSNCINDPEICQFCGGKEGKEV